MDEPTDAPRRADADHASYLRALYRDEAPRRVYIDDEDAVARTSSRQTLWRAESSSDPVPPPPPPPEGDLLPVPFAEEPAPLISVDGPRHVRDDEPDSTRFRRTVGYTLLSTLVPGLGLVGSQQRGLRRTGAFIAVASIFALVALAGFFAIRVQPEPGQGWFAAAAASAVGLASAQGMLHVLTVVIAAVGLLWVGLIVATHVATRSWDIPRGKRTVGAVLVALLAFAISAPLAVGANYAQVLSASIGRTFGTETNVISGSKPTVEAGNNPFAGIPRLNILLLGSDLDQERIERYEKLGYGLRTDTLILASVDTTTGATALIQIPRNVQRTPFPEGSEMAGLYPDGFRGEGDPAEWYVNSIWERVVADHPDLFAGQTYPGAEALKQGIEGITGLPVHYFAMLNIDGLRGLVDAMGGVTVNINERLPMGGSSNNKSATWGWLEPGPNQHLDGTHALWYARSRWNTDDYSRMQRQSCLIKAITDQANPTTLLTRFEAIAGASSDMVTTDIPREALEGLTELALKTQTQPMKRLVFVNGANGYDHANPDFEIMRERVDELIHPAPSPSSSSSPTATVDEATPKESPSASERSNEGAQDIADACAYNPVEEEG